MTPTQLQRALRDARNRERNKGWNFPILKRFKRKRTLGDGVLLAIVRGELCCSNPSDSESATTREGKNEG